MGNYHNGRHLTNMERLWTVFHAAAEALNVHIRVDRETGLESDLDRMGWRLKNGRPLIKKEAVPRPEWIDIYTRKTCGVPFSKWSKSDQDAVRRFIEACDAHGTNGW